MQKDLWVTDYRNPVLLLSSLVLCQKSLFERGKESLESEFRSLMTRHTKPVPPILILDLISGDDEMDTQEEMSLEQLPESVLHDVIRISGWLVENGRNQGWQCCVVFPCSSLLSALPLVITWGWGQKQGVRAAIIYCSDIRNVQGNDDFLPPVNYLWANSF